MSFLNVGDNRYRPFQMLMGLNTVVFKRKRYSVSSFLNIGDNRYRRFQTQTGFSIVVFKLRDTRYRRF